MTFEGQTEDEYVAARMGDTSELGSSATDLREDRLRRDFRARVARAQKAVSA